MIAGFEQPSAGLVLLDGEEITGRKPHDLAKLGLARTFQIVQPFAGLSVRENIAVGAFLRLPKRRDALALAEQVGQRLGLGPQLDKPAAALTVAGRKRLEVARALATRPRILLLDEVLAGLNPSELRDFLPVLQDIRAGGVTILMIEHVMQAVMSLCEHVHVLAGGRIIASGEAAEVVRNPAVIEAYLGPGAAQRLAAHA
jgi:branched-chain amino acid transport system ATP-binding protein